MRAAGAGAVEGSFKINPPKKSARFSNMPRAGPTPVRVPLKMTLPEIHAAASRLLAEGGSKN